MERIPVSSSNISLIGYDSDTEILEVSFLNGSVYEYKNVPQIVYDSLMNAPSHGTFLNNEIKNLYPSEKVG